MGTLLLVAFFLVVFVGVGVGMYWPASQALPTVTSTPSVAQADDNGGEC